MLHRAPEGSFSDDVDPTVWDHFDTVLAAILEVTKAPDGAFHARSAEALASALGCHTAFVSELVRDPAGDRVQTLAVWSQGRPAQNFDYPIEGTPCEEVFRTGVLQVQSDVARLYPDDVMLNQIEAESYIGTALLGPHGEPLGHLAAMSNRPMADAGSSAAIIRIFAARVEAFLARRAVESQLEGAENNFQLLFEESPNAIVLFDPDTWKPVEFNDLAAEFMGYTRTEFARLTITDLEFAPNPNETREHVERIRRSGGDVFEGLHKAKDGSARNVIVSLRMTPWKGRQIMLTLWHDITARKAAEAALEASESKLQSIVDTAMDAVVILDGEGLITRLNPAAENTFGCSAKEVLGRPAQRFFPGTKFAKLLSQVASESEGPGGVWVPQGLNALRADGEVLQVDLTLSRFVIDQAPFFTLILRDVNDRVRVEQQLRTLQEDKEILQEQLSERSTVVGESPALLQAFSHVEKVAATDSTVLILGETGTGKELIARAIHERSVRRNRVMVTVNCAALPRDLLESELFGHEKGAFTGATQRRRGRFELANGGTLFLDEIGELSPDAQAKLLRALQEGEIQPVGGETTIRVNVRVIAATHQDLKLAVEEGRFRSDLYYRLTVFPLRLPPLRERASDVSLLIDHFVSIYSGRFGKVFTGFDDQDIDQLCSYSWPGNVRELQNVIERAAILSAGGELTLQGSLLGSDAFGGVSRPDELTSVTRRHLERVLTDCQWVVAGPKGAAARLQMNPSTLRFRMKKLGIRKPG